MSKRFGRNQRRKARQEIAELKEQSAEYALRYQASLQRKEQLEASVANTAAILGSRFAGLPPEVVAVLKDRHDVSLASYSGAYTDYSNLAMRVDYAIHHLSAYESNAHLDKLRGLMHVVVQSPAGRRYAVTQECIRLPRSAFAQHVFENVGRQLVEQMLREFTDA